MQRALILVFLLAGRICVGQPDFRFHQYGLPQGLPSPGIRDIIEDAYGLIWIGTNNGLACFNGYEFKVFRKSIGSHRELNSNDVTALFALPDGDLLVGTALGLHIFDHRKQQFRNYWRTLPPSYIAQIVADRKGGFWIGTSTGLYHLAGTTDTPTAHFPDESSPLYNTGIFSIYLDDESRLWITTSRKGFFKLDLKSNELTNYRHRDDDPASLSSDVMRQMVALTDGRLVLGTADAGYNIFDPRTDKFERHNHNPADPSSLSSTAAFSLLLDSHNNLWVGTWANGLNLISTDTWKGRYFKNDPGNVYSIASNSVTTLFESSTGDIWMGSSASGVSRITPAEQKFFRYRHDSQQENTLTTPYVRAIYEDDDGQIWLGTNQGGLNRFDPATRRYTVYLKPDESRDALSRGSIWSIDEAANGDLWLGTSRGVARFNRTTGRASFIDYEAGSNDPRKLSGNNVLRVLDDHSGSLWVGLYYSGLNRVDLETGTVEKFYSDANDTTSISSNNVNDVFIDRRNRIWVGCDEGLNLFDRKTGKFRRYIVDQSIGHINQGSYGEIYVGTDRGLMILNPETGAMNMIGEADGLHADHVNGVLVDDAGHLWLSSDQGIARYDPATGTIATVDEASGLVADDTEARSCFKSKTGVLYFGGTRGVTSFDPATIMDVRPAPGVVFTNLSVLNKTVVVNDSAVLRQSIHTLDHLELAYADYIFALEFAAVEYATPQKIKYAYQLEGFDPNWIHTTSGDRKAVYTNVPDGTYTFKVKASDVHGKFGEAFTTLKITVTPPWWRTWWAQVLFYGSGVALVVVLFRLRVAFVERQNKLLEEQVAARTSEVIQQREELQLQAEALQQANLQKSKLFSIIAHDLKGPLNTLKSVLTLIDPAILTSADLDRIKKEISQRVEGISGAMENLLGWAYGQMELESVRPERVDVGRIGKEMLDLYTPIASNKGIMIESALPPGQFAFADLNLLRAVLRNLVSNAIKFTRPGGAIILSAKLQQQELVLEVRDSGVGMEPDQLNNLFSPDRISTPGTGGERGIGLGLQVVQDFVSKMNGRLWVESKPGEGTSFYFAIPAAAAEEHVSQ